MSGDPVENKLPLKIFGEAKEHSLTGGSTRTYCCYMLLYGLFLGLLPVDIAFVGMVTNPWVIEQLEDSAPLLGVVFSLSSKNLVVRYHVYFNIKVFFLQRWQMFLIDLLPYIH